MALAGENKDEYSAAFNEDDSAAKKAQNDDPFEFDTPAKATPVTESKAESTDLPAAEPAQAAPAPAKKQSFKEAFTANRKSGNAEFEWNGKKYNTAMATDKVTGATPPAAAKPKASSTASSTDAMGNEGRHSLASKVDMSTQSGRDAQSKADMDKQPLVKMAKAVASAFSSDAPTRGSMSGKGAADKPATAAAAPAKPAAKPMAAPKEEAPEMFSQQSKGKTYFNADGSVKKPA